MGAPRALWSQLHILSDSKKRKEKDSNGSNGGAGGFHFNGGKARDFRGELVQGVLPDCDETFGGGQGDGQERLSPEPAQTVKVRARKGREI